MARTAVTVAELTANGSVADAATNAVDPTNGHVISGVQLEELVLRVNLTFAGSKNVTIKAGANPPALSAGKGDLVVAINNTTKIIGPFTSERFVQKDGTLN